MSTQALRRRADLDRLTALATASHGRIRLLDAPAAIGRSIRIELDFATAGGRPYPDQVQRGLRLRIDTPARYPFERPVVTVETPVFHPNVFPSGVVCQGQQWLPSEGMDLFVLRIARLLTFDPAFVNPASPANRLAADWYLKLRAQRPQSFPSDRIDLAVPIQSPPVTRPSAPGASASTGPSSPAPADATGERVIRACPRCQRRLRLPAGRSGIVACPGCGHEFEASTR